MRRYISDCPEILNVIRNKKQRVHEPAKSIEGLTKENEGTFRFIAERIRMRFPDVKVYAFGSRVNGNFTDESDFDIMLANCSVERFEKIKVMLKLTGIKVDVKLTSASKASKSFGIEL